MFTKIAAITLAIAVSAPAFAMTPTQLERSVGVESGVYTLSQLTALSGATDANERARLKRFFTQVGDSTVSRNDFGDSGAPVRTLQRQSEQ
jgi:hypothetical protein